MQVPPNSDLTLGMTCVDKATPGRCTWRMTADERFANPAGIMQGGFLAAFADSAMGAAAVTFVEGRKVFAANAEMKISFLAAVPPGRRPHLHRRGRLGRSPRRLRGGRASLGPRARIRARRLVARDVVDLHRSRSREADAGGPAGVCTPHRAPTRIARHMAPRSDNGTPRAAPRRRRRLPAHRRLPQAGDASSPSRASAASSPGASPAPSAWPSASC